MHRSPTCWRAVRPLGVRPVQSPQLTLGRHSYSQQPCSWLKRRRPTILLAVRGTVEPSCDARPSLTRLSELPCRKRHSFTTTASCQAQSGPPSDPPSSSSSSKKQPLGALLAATAHENIYTLPNLLTFTRLLAGPGLAYLILHDQHAYTLALFVYAGLTDLIDGWLARRWGQHTVLGSIMDPLADKTLMTATTLALAAQARLPMPLAVIILGRDALLGLAALYYRWISLPPPKTMARYWDVSLPTAEVRPTAISKANTALQLVLVGATVAMPLVSADLVAAGHLATGLVGLQWVVGTTTVWSGLSYVWSKDAVRIIGKDTEKKEGEAAGSDGHKDRL